MNTQSNNYIFIYSSIIVIIVATLLAAMATALKPAQMKNVEIEKKQNILAAIHIPTTKASAEKLYETYIVDNFTLDFRGSKTGEQNAFGINLREELKRPVNQRQLPVYAASKNDTLYYVIPVYGSGLWGPIWGYISLQPEKPDTAVNDGLTRYSKVYGAFFDHKAETPGLGAEIVESAFQAQFTGRKIFDSNDKFQGIKVIKPGTGQGANNEVDAISGGTITSKGVQSMIDSSLANYKHFLISVK